MNNIYNLIARAQKLRKETQLGSISPERVGSILEDTCKYLNDAQIFADSLVHKVYESEEDFFADTEHISDLTGRPMMAGQLMYIYGPDALYRYDGGNAKTLLKEHALDAIPQLNELREALISLNDAKADKDGRYPEMSVGFADDLVGRGESVPAEFSFRASGGKSIKDGTARVKRLKGNSVVWNQKIQRTYKTTTHNGVTFTVNDDGSVLVNGTAGDGGVAYITVVRMPVYTSHKYYVFGGIDSGSRTTWFFGDGNNLNCYDGTPIIANASKDSTGVTFAIRVAAGISVDNILFPAPKIIDLTQMFGAGYEPTTIEEFNARKPIVEDEYAYNEGEVIHMTAEGIKSVGDNAWDEEWEAGSIVYTTGETANVSSAIRSKNHIEVLPNSEYYYDMPANYVLAYYDADKNYISGTAKSASQKITTPPQCRYMKFGVGSSTLPITTYNNDIMITLVHSGWKQDTDAGYQPYWEDRLIFDQRIKDEFPDGMKSAGTAYDVAYNDMNKGVGVTETRIRMVDLGDLDWFYIEDDTVGKVFSGQRISAVNIANRPLHVCAKYTPMKASTIYADLDIDKIITIEDGFQVRVRDSAYTDAASFKAAMAGVLLYYELAEPTIIEYDEPFNLDYRVADFGTEQAIAEQPSAPISADIIYQFNAVDMIREHEIEIAELQSIITEQQSIIATMQAQLDGTISKNEEIK